MHLDKPCRTIARPAPRLRDRRSATSAGKSLRLAAGQLRAAAQVRKNRNSLLQTAAGTAQPESTRSRPGCCPIAAGGLALLRCIKLSISDQYYDLIEDDDGGMIDELTARTISPVGGVAPDC